MNTPNFNPEAHVAGLIAELPDDFGDLTPSDLRSLMTAHEAILDILRESALAAEAVLDRIEPRITSPTQPIAEVMTEAEQAEFEGAHRRHMHAERASAALNTWEERSGAARYGWPCMGPSDPCTIEAPDGTLELRIK
jgi:hypothetical protein